MQAEFPGYTQDQFIEDITRKTKQRKNFRRPKPRRFDWVTIRKEIPDFFNACKKRTPTKAILHGKTKDGEKFTLIVRSSGAFPLCDRLESMGGKAGLVESQHT